MNNKFVGQSLPPMPASIQRWIPNCWDGFVGNSDIKRLFASIEQGVRRARTQKSSRNPFLMNLFVGGPSRTGKTAMIRHLVRSILCVEYDSARKQPCTGTCKVCSQHPEVHGLEGMFSYSACEQDEVPVHFAAIDCTKTLSPESLLQDVQRLDGFEGLKIFFFDEVHRLEKRSMDELLLNEVMDKNALWIFATAKPENLEAMFLKRMLVFNTELPKPEDLESWLVGRCREWGLTWESKAIVRIVQKCNCNPGIALQALALAAVFEDRRVRYSLINEKWNPHLGD